jgi:hypothetical protein
VAVAVAMAVTVAVAVAMAMAMAMAVAVAVAEPAWSPERTWAVQRRSSPRQRRRAGRLSSTLGQPHSRPAGST